MLYNNYKMLFYQLNEQKALLNKLISI